MGSEALSRYGDLGLLVLRVGIGVMLMAHGVPKMMGGVPVWKGLGQAMAVLGISFVPEFWGFMAAFAEVFGGLALITGIFFVPFAIMLTFEMVVAMFMHLNQGADFATVSHPIELAIVFLSLIFIGPGKYVLLRF
jgi:putative oxidoreductase